MNKDLSHLAKFSGSTVPSDDNALQQAIFSLLSDRVKASAYGSESAIAAEIATLPVGLRAMAATHHLDVSLTLDSICWHFRNFGEPRFVAMTEAGLRELGLIDLANCFHEAALVMLPLADEDAGDWSALLDRHGIEGRVDAINRRAWDLDGGAKSDRSMIYGAWLRYARQNPGLVFA